MKFLNLNSIQIFSKNIYFTPKRFVNQQVRVRFAPSPTGKLHIGGLRTAFYNYLFARKYKGKFLLRIEDTDQERFQSDSIENIIESLRWAGLEPDYGPHLHKKDDLEQGGPWLQSKRLDIYHKYVQILLDSQKAYMCFCDEARLSLLRRNAAKKQEKLSYDGKCRHLSQETRETYLKEGRPYVIRFKLEDKEVSFNDLTTGIHKSNPAKQEGDFIIIKSDKFPTYHFANVVDDHLMQITHVLRGQEWQLSTAKHILLYEAFGWQHPIFAHLPLICNNDGTKISKRQNDIDVLSYKRRGYMPETVLSYLSTIGGGLKINILEENMFFKDSKNVLGELVENFDETKMCCRPVKLNQELLDNLNRRFIKLKIASREKQNLINDLRDLLSQKYSNLNKDYASDNYLKSVVDWAQDRIFKLNDLVEDEKNSFLWSDLSNFNLEDKNLPLDVILNLISLLKECLQNLNLDLKESKNNDFIKQSLSDLFKKNASILRISGQEKSKKVNNWQLTRLVLTGNLEGPPVMDIFNLLGKENVLYRLNVAEKTLKSKINSN